MAEEDGAIKNQPLPDVTIGDGDAELLKIARERYEKAQKADDENREQGIEDLEFLAGDMWDENSKAERLADRRPTLTIDKISQALAQVSGDIRQNNPSIKVRPADGAATTDIAKIYTGLIRHIENKSDAGYSYESSADSAAQCGIGHFRIVTEYCDDDTFEQDIRIRFIPDAFSVSWDPHAVLPTRMDAEYCFVEETIDRTTYEARFPDAPIDNWETMVSAAGFSTWFQHETVRIAEYWTKTKEKRTLALIDRKTVDVTDYEEVDVKAYIDQIQDPETKAQLEGIEKAYLDQEENLLKATRVRVVYRNKIEMRLICGAKVLEGPFTWVGKYIPIIPVLGEVIHIKDKTIRLGMVRRAKDPQRLYNIWRSSQTEKIALEPKVPWLVTIKNITGAEDIWKQANERNIPYLPYTPDPDNGGQAPQRIAPQMGSAAMAADIQLADQDIKSATRIYDPALGNKSNETSGVAIRERKQESDIGTYIYFSNLKRSLRYAGEILVDIIPRIYDTERMLRVLNEDDTQEFVEINKTVRTKDGKQSIVVNDLSQGKYDVLVTTGPAFTTRREEAVEGMKALAQALPEKAGLFLDLIIKNLDWPGAEEIAERLRKTLPPGLIEPDPEEPPAPPPPPTPEQIEAEAKIKADAADQERKNAETQAKIAKMEAETEATQLENVQKATELALQDEAVQQIIADQVNEILSKNGLIMRQGEPVSSGPTPGLPGPEAAGAPPQDDAQGWLDFGDGVKMRPMGNA